MPPIDIPTGLPEPEAIAVLRARMTPLTFRTRLELVTKRSFTGVVEAGRVRIWPIGPSGGVDGEGAWHQWRPVFDGHWAARDGMTHLMGQIVLNRAIPLVVAAVTLILGAWLFAGLSAVALAFGRGTGPDSMLVFGGVAMPILFAFVAAGIFWLSYQLYRADRSELEAFMLGIYDRSDEVG